jgi:hypothetical protein
LAARRRALANPREFRKCEPKRGDDGPGIPFYDRNDSHAEGFGAKVPKGYVYAAMLFSDFIEALKLLSKRAKLRKTEEKARVPAKR